MHCAGAPNVALVPAGSGMNRMRVCDSVRRAAGPYRQVQPFLAVCGLGSQRISLSILQICVRSGSAPTLRGELPTARCGPNTEAFANFPQLRSGGRKETAQQSNRAELLHRLLPTLGIQFSRSMILTTSAEIQALLAKSQLNLTQSRKDRNKSNWICICVGRRSTRGAGCFRAFLLIVFCASAAWLEILFR